MENKQYLVTILVLAYNHENYISQTIDSVLSQKTTFDYKILITEDASTDGTRSIVQDYMSRYPSRVFALLNEKNIGLNETLKRAIPLIDTKYTCILGGDDYWNDDNKLQMQVEVLENDSSITFVHTGFDVLDEAKNCIVPGINTWQWNMPKDRDKRLMSFLNHDFSTYPCSSTCCFLSEPFQKCFKEHPQLLDYTVGEGTLLHVAMCMYGNKYMFMPNQTIVYRKRQNSLSHYQDKVKKLDYYMGYINLKIAAFKMFGIREDDYWYVIKNDINSNFKIAYRDNTLGRFREVVKSVDVDKTKSDLYDKVASNCIASFVYYWMIRGKSGLKALCK